MKACINEMCLYFGGGGAVSVLCVENLDFRDVTKETGGNKLAFLSVSLAEVRPSMGYINKILHY